MTRKEQVTNKVKEIVHESGYNAIPSTLFEMATWADKTMIDKACECYCDDICDKGRCCMCFHKHDNKGQVKNDFQYNECNELKLIRKAMEE